MQREDENTMTYFQRLNEEILNLNRLLKPITTEALINRVYKYFFFKERLYTLPDKIFSV
jgi:inorganic pyrophosphatase/exopolyphosphatase